MSVLINALPVTAQANLINKDLASMLNDNGISIEILVQEKRPSTDWLFLGETDLIQSDFDIIIDLSVINTVSKVRKAFNFEPDRSTILPIYKEGDVFHSIKSKGSEAQLLGFAILSTGVAVDIDIAMQDEHIDELTQVKKPHSDHEEKLNQVQINQDIEDLTIWHSKSVFEAKLVNVSTGETIANLYDIHNHHRDLESNVNRYLRKNSII